MSVRFGPPLITDAVVYGVPGLGVLGSVIRATTATGTHGPGLLYPCVDSPADDNKEFRWKRVEGPNTASLFVFEDGRFTWPGLPNGSYQLRGRLFVDSVDLGLTPYNIINVGVASEVSIGAATVKPTAAIVARGGARASIAATTTRPTVAIAAGAASRGSIVVVTPRPVPAITARSSPVARISAAAPAPVVSMQAGTTSRAAINATAAPPTASIVAGGASRCVISPTTPRPVCSIVATGSQPLKATPGFEVDYTLVKL